MAVVLFAIFLPVGIVYGLFLGPWSIGYLAQVIQRIAVGIDQLANIVFAGLFNRTLVRGVKPFGLEDDTISEVLSKNRDHLTGAGKMIAMILEYIDPNHLDKALIENKTYFDMHKK